MAPVSKPKTAKKAQPIMLATRSGTMVWVSRVATKKTAPTSANMLASVMLCRKISSRRLKIASQVTLSGSSPIWIRSFGDPEVVGRRIEDAIQRVGHVCAEEHCFRQSAGGGF